MIQWEICDCRMNSPIKNMWVAINCGGIGDRLREGMGESSILERRHQD